jgi:hypothetical protein
MVAPVGYFVNHVEQLDKIKQNLVKFRKTSLVGISGIGKTQLVRMYAYENRENYDLIWFFDCNLDLNDQLLKLAQAINKKDTTAHISEDLKVLKKQVFDYLTDKEGWLLVLDNLKIGENNKAHEFVTWENNGHIILCSQESNGITNIINLIRLSEDSIKVLSKNLLEDENEHSLDFLIKELDGYPVLIVQGVQLLNNIKGLDREEYKKMTFKESDKIITNIKLAWKELSSDARELASIIAIINNQEFSKNFLKSVVPLELDLSDAIYQLTKLGLIQNINTSTEGAIFEMHDIIAVNITQLNQSNNKQYIEDILLRIVSSMPKDIIKGFAYRRQEIVQKNIEVIQRNAEKFKADLQNVMSLKLNLFSDYTNNYDFYKSAQMVNWFYNQDQDLLFKAMNKNDESIKIYANYLCLIGAYYRNKYMDYL